MFHDEEVKNIYQWLMKSIQKLCKELPKAYQIFKINIYLFIQLIIIYNIKHVAAFRVFQLILSGKYNNYIVKVIIQS